MENQNQQNNLNAFEQPQQPVGQPQFGQVQQPQFGQVQQPVEQPQFGQVQQPVEQPQFGQVQPQMQQEQHPQFAPAFAPLQENGEPQQTFTPNGGSVPPTKKKKGKKLLIFSIIGAALLILAGGIAYGVYAFMSTPQSKLVSMIERTEKAKKVEGKLEKGDFTISGQKVTVTKMEYTFSREPEKGKFFYLGGRLDTKLITSKADADHVFAVSFTDKYELQWSILGQKGSQKITGEDKTQLESIIKGSESEGSKAAKELQKFLVNGYSPKVSTEGNQTVITLDKSEIRTLAEKIQNNIKGDQEKFKTLFKKVSPTITEDELDTAVEAMEAGKLLETVNQGLEAIEVFEMKIGYEEVNGNIKQTLKVKAEASDFTGDVVIATTYIA